MHRTRRRRRLRDEAPDLPRGDPRLLARPAAAPSGQVDRGPLGALRLDHPRPRAVPRRSRSATTTTASSLGLRDHAVTNTGAYLAAADAGRAVHRRGDAPRPVPDPEFRGDVDVVMTNKTPMNPFRGVGHIQAAQAMERIMDMIARELGLDPAEVRRRNMLMPEELPLDLGVGNVLAGEVVYDSGDYPTCLRRGARAHRLRRVPRRAGSDARRGPLPRHRHRLLRRGDRPRPVRDAAPCGSSPRARSSCSPARARAARAISPSSPRSPRTSSPSARRRRGPLRRHRPGPLGRRHLRQPQRADRGGTAVRNAADSVRDEGARDRRAACSRPASPISSCATARSAPRAPRRRPA